LFNYWDIQYSEKDRVRETERERETWRWGSTGGLGGTKIDPYIHWGYCSTERQRESMRGEGDREREREHEGGRRERER
jgi:hypothetical protein